MRRATRWDTAETNATLLAFDGEAACQIVGSYVEEQNPQRAADHLGLGRSFVQARGGVGKTLIEAVLERSKSRNVHEVKLMVTSINQNAIAFYERMGF